MVEYFRSAASVSKFLCKISSATPKSISSSDFPPLAEARDCVKRMLLNNCWVSCWFLLMSAFGVHSKYLRMRNERKAASVLDVRCVVAFFRSKVAASWRKLVVFIVYDGRAVELILDCQQGSSITLHGLCSCILPWGGSEGQTGRPVTQKHAPAHIKTVRTKPIYRRFALTGHL